MAEKFRFTKQMLEMVEDDDGIKTVTVLSGLPLVTAVMDAPETIVSVGEDVCGKVASLWCSIFD